MILITYFGGICKNRQEPNIIYFEKPTKIHLLKLSYGS